MSTASSRRGWILVYPFMPAFALNGANDGTRIHDLVLTKDALYQLSYAGKYEPKEEK